MRWLAAVAGGVLTGLLWAGPPWWTCAVSAASVAVVVTPRRLRHALLVVAVVGAGAGRGAWARDAHLSAPILTAVSGGDPADAPTVAVSGRLLDDASVDAGVAHLSLRVDRLRRGDQWMPTDGPIALTVSGAFAPTRALGWTRGRRITTATSLRPVTIWRNPGAMPESWQRLKRDAVAVGHVKSAALVMETTGPWWADAQAGVRRYVRQAVAAAVGRFGVESAAVVSAILIGDRSSLDDATTRRLQAAGTYHVIAISGGNIAILVMAVLGVLQPWSHHPRAIALLAIAVVLAYGGVVVAAASVLRAIIAATIALGLAALGLRARPLRIWCATAAVVALVDPLRMIDSGAWLSFGATAGLLAWSAPIYAACRPARRQLRPVVALLAATVAAEAAVAPITAAVFGQISVAGLVLNLIAIPAMAVVELAGMVAVGLHASWPTAAQVAGGISHLAVRVLLGSARLVDLAPWLVWMTPPQPIFWGLLYYSGLSVCGWPGRLPGPSRHAAMAVTVAAFVTIAWSPPWPWWRAPAGVLRVTFLDVGQGDAIVAELPSGRALLVDAGGASPGFDVGERVVRPALWALGRRDLDWLVLTHGDVDHAGGLPRLMEAFRPREFWDGVPVSADPRWQLRRRQIAAAGTVWRQVQAGDYLEDGPVRIDVWHPPRPDWERPVVRNDDSVVLRLAYGDISLLLTGDAGRDVEAGWPPLAGRLRVVQVPHHGSRGSSGPAFLRATAPHAAVVSVGRGNTFGHPASDVLAAYREAGASVFRTDQDGAVTLETDGRRLTVRTWNGRMWEAAAVEIGGGRPK